MLNKLILSNLVFTFFLKFNNSYQKNVYYYIYIDTGPGVGLYIIIN